MKSIQFIVLVVVALATTVQAQNQVLAADQNAAVQLLSDVGEKTASGAQIVSAYQEGAAITKLYDKFGLVNEQGYEIAMPRFEAVHAFQNGYAAVKLHGKWTFVNKQGKKIAPYRYDWVGNFDNGFAPVQVEGKWSFINEQGAKIHDVEFDAVRTFEDNRAIVLKGDTWYFLTSKGKLEAIKSTAKVTTFSTAI